MKFLIILMLIAGFSNAQTLDQVDDFFTSFDQRLLAPEPKPEPKIEPKPEPKPVVKKEVVISKSKNVYPINLSLIQYSSSVSFFSDYALHEKGFFVEVKVNSKDLPFLKQYIEKFSNLDSTLFFSSSFNSRRESKILVGVDLKYHLKQGLISGSKLYIDFNRNVEALGYLGHIRFLGKKGAALFYLGLKTGEFSLASLDTEKLKNQASSISLSENSILGIHLDFNRHSLKDVALGIELNKQYAIVTLFRRF